MHKVRRNRLNILPLNYSLYSEECQNEVEVIKLDIPESCIVTLLIFKILWPIHCAKVQDISFTD